MKENPFLTPYNTPHQTTPFDKISNEDFKPALEEGMRQENIEIENIINNPEAPTFENTILPLERSGELLGRVSTVMGNLISAETNDTLEALAEEMMPAITEHNNNIAFNQKLFERIKAVYKSKSELNDEEKKLLKDCYEGFLRRGVGLSKKKKQHLQEISLKLSTLGLQFSQNVLKDTNRYQLLITNKEDLEGLPELQQELARQAAAEKKKDGWLFTLHAPSYQPLLTYLKNRDIRRKVFLAMKRLGCGRNKFNNVELVKQLVSLRLDYAQTLGFKTYADLALEHRMAENVPTVMKFLNNLLEAYRKPAEKEYKEIEDLAKELEGKDFVMKPWDVAYYAHKLQLRKYNYDQDKLRPYFELGQVIDGVFGLATRLYGITFKENMNIPVYHPDVKAYEVFDEDGSYLAVLYADFHPRSSKKSGAWMTSFQEQYIDKDGNNIRPHVSITMNLTKPTEKKPALLSLGEVTTFMHEFGHALHEILSQCRFESQSGTNVYWDFVELPSQFMENFAMEKDFLKTFAFHYQTKEPIPEELIDNVIKSRTQGAAGACMRQLSFGLLDMAYYTRTEPFDEDVYAFEKKAWKPAIIHPDNLKGCMSTHFQHIMTGGYAAGYYSYKWAEVLDADAFGLFQETGIFNKDTATRFRKEILEKGGKEHPKVLYRNYRKRNANINALLKRDGITKKM